MLRLVATDLDGTLLHSDGTVTERTRRALTEVEDLGVTVVFVTGRPIRWMDDLWQHVGGHGLAVCSNGGIVYDVHEHEVRRARTIPVGTGLEVGVVLRAAIPGTTFAIERTDGFAKEPTFLPRLPPPPDLVQGPLEEILDDRAVKLLARHEELGPERFWEQVESHVGHLVTTTWSSVGALVEMSAAGVTKASTLELVCEERGIARDDVRGLRGHAQRPADAGVGRHVLRDGQRARVGARPGRPRRAAQRRGRRGPGARAALRPGNLIGRGGVEAA